MGNQIQNLNNLSEDRIIKEEKIIKATINSTISLSQSKILINESEFQSISDYSKNNKNNDSTNFYLINKSRYKRIEDNNKIIRNPHTDNNNKTYTINQLYKNINYNNNKNNNNGFNLNLENDSKFIDLDIINDNSELYELSKIDDDLLFNEKENKDINDEYEFEEYITKLNSKNINIDKQLNERPLFSPFILNSNKIYQINRKDSKINDDNNISKIIRKKINKRNKKKECFNDLKINQNNKAIKIFETTNSLYVNKNKYYDYQSTNQRSKSKSKNTNEKTVSSNTNITNIEYLNNSSRQKKIILINSDNNIFQDNNRIKKKNNEYINKEKIKKNLKLHKISKKKIELNNNTIFEKENKMKNKKEEAKNKYLSNNSRKIKRMLTEKRNINEKIKINNLTNLILDSNRTKIRNLKKNLHTSLSQTFEIKKPNGNIYNYKSCSSFIDINDKKNKNKISNVFNKFNKISPKKEETKRNKKNLKLTYSCSNLFSKNNKIIFNNKNINLSNKRKNKNSKNYLNLNYYKISPISHYYKNKKGKELFIEKKYKTNLNSNEKPKNKYINTSEKTTIFKNKKNKETILFEINKNKGAKNNINNKPKKMKRNNYEIIKKKNNKLQISVSYKRFNLINNYKDNSPNDNNYSKKRNIYKMINIGKLLNKDNDDIYKFKNIILSAS